MSPKVADLTVDELKELLHETIRELVEEVVEEKLGALDDPDEGLELQPEVADSLRHYLKSERRGDDADEVFRQLGLE
jgi:ribosomal protein L29